MKYRGRWAGVMDICDVMQRNTGDTSTFFPDPLQVQALRSLLIADKKLEKDKGIAINQDRTVDIYIEGDIRKNAAGGKWAKVLFKNTQRRWVFLSHNLFPSGTGVTIEAMADRPIKHGHWACLDSGLKQVLNSFKGPMTMEDLQDLPAKSKRKIKWHYVPWGVSV